MNFSELFRQSNQICRFSPDGKYLASVVEFRLVIRDVDTFQIQNLFSCMDTIQQIEWSADSQFILCGLYKRGLVQVWSLEQPDWKCKIDEGSAGLCDVRWYRVSLHWPITNLLQIILQTYRESPKKYPFMFMLLSNSVENTQRWSPDSRHVLTTADFHLRITVWSLVTKSVSYIRYPKQCQKNIDFSPDDRYMALAERRDCQDFISIFSCNSWELVKHFEASTEDLSGIQWSPDSSVLCVWDTPLRYLLLLYSVDGRCLSKFSAYDYALGIKTLKWSPSSQFLALGSYDEKLRLLNHVTWKTITSFEHPETIEDKSTVVYKEMETRTPQAVKNNLTDIPTTALFSPLSKYEVQTCPCTLPIVKPDTNKANPKRGVGLAAFSQDCKYLFTRNDNMPHTLWIWDIRKLSICAVIIQSAPIKHIEWDPVHTRLALCTGVNKLYMWSPAGSLCVEVPVEGTFQVHSLKWHPDGGSLLLLGKDMMCICYLNDDGKGANDEPES